MTQRLVVAHFPMNRRDSTGIRDCLMTVLYEDGRAVEMYLSDPDSTSILGNVYTGVIEQVQKSTNGAFVRLTDKLRGYLPLRDGLKAGMVIPVQVEKEAIKMKLPRLTENIRLTGRFLVVCSGWKGVKVSSKIDPAEKKILKQTFFDAISGKITDASEKRFASDSRNTSDVFEEFSEDDDGTISDDVSEKKKKNTHEEYNLAASLQYGVILRTNAAGCTTEELCEEYSRLVSQMDDILLKGRTRTGGSCLWNGDPVWLQLFRQIRKEDCERVITDDPAVFHDLARQTDMCELYQDKMVELFRLYNLSTRFAEAASKKVWLKSGGFLVIEQTEAFVCIDVNTGRYSGKKSAEETALMTNHEAAAESARQIRLRQLSGTILIDFINMKEENDREELINCMREQVHSDHAGVQVIDMTPLGIMELTRQKKTRSLQEQCYCLTEADDGTQAQ